MVNDPRNEHLEEDAELYALGALPDTERAAAEAHVAQCDACARRVGEAEGTLASLVRPQTPSSQLDRRVRATFAPRSSSARAFYPLVAAALIVALLPGAFFWQRDRDLRASDAVNRQAVAAMIGSHFLHSQFVKIAPDAPPAKAIFARNGAWLYVIAVTGRDLTLTGGGHVLGKLWGTGNERAIFVEHPPATRSLTLSDGSRVLARVAVAVP
jgi:ferric-dicitrate binding protein FerR (iron transport regulator)